MKKSFSIKQFSFQIFAGILGIFTLGQLIFAQQPDRGFQTANTYAASGLDLVNTTNGNLMLNIPIASLPAGRGTSPGYSITLQYNSKLWESNQTTHNDGNPDEYGNVNYITTDLALSPNGGWRLQTGYSIQVISRLNFVSPNPCWKGDPVEQLSYIWKLEMLMPDGSIKQFFPETGRNSYTGMGDDGYANIDYNGKRYIATKLTDPTCTVQETTSQVSTTGMTYITMDGSRLRLFIPYHSTYLEPNSRNWKLYFPDGTMVEQLPPDNTAVAQRITDRNGNFIEHRDGKIIDQLGRYIEFIYDSENNEQTIRVKGVGGENVETKLHWGYHWVQKPYRRTTEASAPTTQRYGNAFADIRTLTEITFPTQLGDQSMEFEYLADETQPDLEDYTEGWGELKKITLPTGATSTYQFIDVGYGSEEDTAADILQRFVSRKDLQYSEQYDNQSPVSRTDSWLYSVSKSINGTNSPNGAINTEHLVFYGAGSNWDAGMVYKSYSPDGSFVERLWNHNIPYSLTSGVPNVPGHFQGVGSANSYVKTEFTTITDASNSTAWTAIKDYKYDKNGNVLEILEYDWIDADEIQRPYGKPVIPTSGLTLKRKTINTYYNQAADAESSTGNSNSYSDPSSPKLKNVIKSTEIQNGSGTPVSRTEYYYDDASNTGNLTEVRVWDSTKGGYSNPLTTGSSGNSISTTTTYNSYGAPTLITDANAVQTKLTYGNVTVGSTSVTGPYPTQTETAYGTAVERTSTAVYDLYTGLVTLSTDVDNDVSTATTYDALGRVTKAAVAVGEPEEFWTTTEYDVDARRVIVRSDLAVKGDGRKVAIQHYDQLGRIRLTRTLDDSTTEDPEDEADGIKVQTRYRYDDGDSPETSNGIYTLTSNPYRAATSSAAGSEPTMGWTLSYTTKTGKHSEVETFSTSSSINLPAPWGSNSLSTGKVQTDLDAERTLVTDQAGKKRISRTNALGHLTDVWEIVPASDSATVSVTFPSTQTGTNYYSYQTIYKYDALNNLTEVRQPIGTTGGQTRSFSYSSLSRILSAENPESGMISYVYDNNGNLTKRTDARSIETNYSYDALNRATARDYSDSTPNVTYTYDNVTNAIGKLTKVDNGISVTEYTEFDILGRVTKSKQTTGGAEYPEMTYTYNLSGALVEQKYPSGRVVKNVLDTNGDISVVQSKKNSNFGFWNYADSFTYTAAGAVSSMQLGNFRWESTQFNSRLQPTQIALGTTPNATNVLKLDYSYGTTANNGNIESQTIIVPTVGSDTGFTAVQTYTYDSLNRIKDAAENLTPQGGTAVQTWKQTFTYDRYGNRSFDEEGTSPNFLTSTLTRGCATSTYNPKGICDKQKINPTFSSNNQIKADQDGDSVNDYNFDSSGNTTKDADNRTFIYDAENKQIEVKNSSNATIGQYFYDGDGKRVKKYVPGTGETTVFIYDGFGKLVAENSTVVETTNARVSYLTNDHLGSPRINTDRNGAVTARHDYQPFGEEIATSQRISALGYTDDTIRKQFTSYERDNETDLDFAQARYYAKNLGRFNSTDPLLSSGRIENPQTWNRYAYVLGNPLKFSDPLGLFEWDETLADSDKLDSAERERRKTIRDKIVASIESAKQRAKAALDAGKISQKKFDKINNALNSYGDPGKANGVTVGIKQSMIPSLASRGETTTALEVTDWGPTTVRAVSKVQFESSIISGDDLETTIVHEGQHVADNFEMATIYNTFLNKLGHLDAIKDPRVITKYMTENNAFHTQSYFYEAIGQNDKQWGTWNKGWASPDEAKEEKKRQEAINKTIKSGYGLDPTNQGSNMLNLCSPGKCF